MKSVSYKRALNIISSVGGNYLMKIPYKMYELSEKFDNYQCSDVQPIRNRIIYYTIHYQLLPLLGGMFYTL